MRIYYIEVAITSSISEFFLVINKAEIHSYPIFNIESDVLCDVEAQLIVYMWHSFA